MNSNYLMLLVSGFLIFTSCQEPATVSTIDDGKFNLKQFIDAEVKRYEAQDLTITKFIELDDKKDHLELNQEDWIDALKLFGKTSFNNQTSVGLYEVDTIQEGFNKTIHYTSWNVKQKPELLTLKYINEELHYIFYSISKENVLFSSIKKYQYYVDSQLIFEKISQTRFLNDSYESVQFKIVE